MTEPIPEHDDLTADVVPGIVGGGDVVPGIVGSGIAAPQARGPAPLGPVPGIGPQVGSAPGMARPGGAPAGTGSPVLVTDLERAPVPGIGWQGGGRAEAAAEPWPSPEPSRASGAFLEPIDLPTAPPAGEAGESLTPQDEQPIELADLDAQEEIELVPADVAPPLASLAAPPSPQAPVAAAQPLELRSTPAAPATPPPAAQPGPADGGEAALREALARASREVIEKIAWEIVPPLAETIIREHVERLVKERQH